jgi:hypothetical protein
MQLTDEEKRMLDGDCGAGVQKAMRMIVKVGELFGAEKTVPISSVQHIPLEPKDWLAEMIQDSPKQGLLQVHIAIILTLKVGKRWASTVNALGRRSLPSNGTMSYTG